MWTIGNLNIGANATLSVTALVNTSGSYSNTATISGTLFDPLNGNNTSVITLAPVAASSDMQVTKTADDITAPAGTNVIFTITALNQGPSNATGIKVTDLLPSGFLYVSHNAASGTSYNTATGTWNIGAMGTGTNKILDRNGNCEKHRFLYEYSFCQQYHSRSRRNQQQRFGNHYTLL